MFGSRRGHLYVCTLSRKVTAIRTRALVFRGFWRLWERLQNVASGRRAHFVPLLRCISRCLHQGWLIDGSKGSR